MFSHCRKIHSESFISAKALRLQVQVGWCERSINPFRVALKRTPKEQDRLVRPLIRLMMDSVRITAFPRSRPITVPILFCSQFVVTSHTRKSIDFRLAQSCRFSSQFILKWLLGERILRSGKVQVVEFCR